MTSVADGGGSVFGMVTEPVWAVDADHLVCYANPAAATALGHGRPADLLGRDGRPATAAGKHPQPGELTGPVRGEGMLARLDGSLLPVEWTLTPWNGPEGGTALYVFRPLPVPLPAGGGAGEGNRPLGLLAHRQTERQRRYAMTLQHGVQERMVRALLGLSLARQELGTAPSGALDLLHDTARDLEEALAGVREVTDGLSPGALRVGGLSAALTALARRCPVPLGFSGMPAKRLPHLVEAHLYLLVVEAVERAVASGRAGRVEVSADLGTSAVVTVQDDGAPPVQAEDIAALAALTERAATLGGTLTVTHAPDTGTTVTAVVPL